MGTGCEFPGCSTGISVVMSCESDAIYKIRIHDYSKQRLYGIENKTLTATTAPHNLIYFILFYLRRTSLNYSSN